MESSRDIKFGQLLAIVTVIADRVFEPGKPVLTQEKMSRYENHPMDMFAKLHSELMEYAPKFGKAESDLMNLFDEILSSMDYNEFNNDPLTGKFLYGYYTKRHDLNSLVGVDEAAEILGLSPGTIKNKCAAGEIKSKKIGKTWIMNKYDLSGDSKNDRSSN